MSIQRSWPVRILLSPFKVIVTLFVLADEAALPIYRPAYEALAGLRIMRTFEGWVATLPRYGILGVLAVPFLGVEPLKILGLYWMGTERFWIGLATLVFAYLTSFLLVERIYHAGRDKLLTIGWFAVCVGFAAEVKDRVIANVKATQVWHWATESARSVRAFARRALGRPAPQA